MPRCATKRSARFRRSSTGSGMVTGSGLPSGWKGFRDTGIPGYVGKCVVFRIRHCKLQEIWMI